MFVKPQFKLGFYMPVPLALIAGVLKPDLESRVLCPLPLALPNDLKTQFYKRKVTGEIVFSELMGKYP